MTSRANKTLTRLISCCCVVSVGTAYESVREALLKRADVPHTVLTSSDWTTAVDDLQSADHESRTSLPTILAPAAGRTVSQVTENTYSFHVSIRIFFQKKNCFLLGRHFWPNAQTGVELVGRLELGLFFYAGLLCTYSLPVAVSFLWNSLQSGIQSSPSLPVLRQRLKHHFLILYWTS